MDPTQFSMLLKWIVASTAKSELKESAVKKNRATGFRGTGKP